MRVCASVCVHACVSVWPVSPEWPVSAGKVIHAMVAHLDAVTSLAVDPNGIYLMSGSEFLRVRQLPVVGP